MKKRFLVVVLLIALIVLGFRVGKAAHPKNFQLRGELTLDANAAPSANYEVGDFMVKWDAKNGGQLTIEAIDRPGFSLWRTIPGEAFVMLAQGETVSTESRGMFNIESKLEIYCTTQTVEKIGRSEISDKAIKIEGTLLCDGDFSTPYYIFIDIFGKKLEMMVYGTDHPGDYKKYGLNRNLYLTYETNEDEHFFGFGEQFTYFDMKGKKVPIWVSEQGVGRGEEPITTGTNLTNGGAGGNAFTSYAAMPLYMTNQMRGFILRGPAAAVFDLRKDDRVQVEVYAPVALISIPSGRTPQELLEKQFSGYQRYVPTLPDWVHAGAIVGMQGGTEKVEAVYAELKKRDMPISAFWLQDWVGQRETSFGKQLWWNWEVDYDRYPGWDKMVADFNQDGVEVMVYTSPCLANIGDLKPNVRRNLFQEAAKQGYLIQNKDGEPYLILNTDFYFGMIDLTNPGAVEWYKSVLLEQVVGSGAKGWMADFGEGLPLDARLPYNGGSGPSAHNHYPELWASLNREVARTVDNEIVFFNRAAYTSSPTYASLFWEGDQLVSWSEYDGIKSAVTGLNTSGLSGMVFNHSDIGGYTTITSPIKNYHRSRELLYRWMEMNAFTLIFRTHEGNQPGNNIQLYTDDETLDTFAYWAKVYAALFDYRKQLVQEAVETGLPVVRHPFIHYPNDPEIWKITYQEFMLGEDFLIAPVTDPDTDDVTAYLPQGRWVHLWSGELYGDTERGEYITISAPIGQPGIFYKAGSTIGETFSKKLKSEGLMP